MKSATRILTLVLALVVGLGLTANAQSAKKSKKESALRQFCPVAYLAMDKAVKGDSKFTSTYKGKTYYFSSADAKKMFDAEPGKYLPKYDGLCATALAMGQKMESKPEIFSIHKDAIYLFSSAEAKAGFDKDPDATIVMADKNYHKK